MNKIFNYRLALIAALAVSVARADQISTELAIYYVPVNDYFLAPQHRESNDCLGLLVEGWAGGYTRSAFSAYGKAPCNKSCGSQKTPTVPLAQLIFGKPSFTLSEAFQDGIVDGTALENPFVSITTISPQLKWEERGAFLGAHLSKRFCNEAIRFGVRARLPYREIQIENACVNDGLSNGSVVIETIGDLYQTRQETIAANTFGGVEETNLVFAARLDFLNVLQSVAFPTVVPLVTYPATNIKIANNALGDNVTQATIVAPNSAIPFVDMIGSTNGAVPTSVRWGDYPANGQPVVQGDGSGLSNLERGRVASDVAYAALGADSAAQGKLFVVPNIDPATNTLPAGAQSVFNAITAAAATFPTGITIVDFINSTGINFCNGTSRGLGDLDLEWYLGYEGCGTKWVDAILGFRIPTSKKLNNPMNVLQQPLGNNGHLEIRPGIALGYEGCSWLRIRLDAMYSFVLKANEIIAAAFEGSTIRNINPCAPANVSWQYFIGHLDFMFLNPRNQCMGFTVGYEPYVKLSDRICFKHRQGFDLGGVAHDLNTNIIRKDSNRVAHKIRTEIFTNTECCNIFAGFNAVVAGTNITRDVDMYLGLMVTF